jgi:hypothetical protein
MALSEKRKQAIYSSVMNRLMDARVKIAMEFDRDEATANSIDTLLYEAMNAACNDAVRAAEGRK